MITVTQLSKRYRSVTALDSIDLTIGAGMFGLIGPNGAGKTTLMRIIAGLLNPTAGQITLHGHDMRRPNERQAAKALIGYLPQDVGTYPNLNAYEFLDYMAILKGINTRAERRRQIDELLARVRLEDVAKRLIKTYSGGMKRRIGIAQALLGDPKVVIVDEPTAGLDPEERIRFRNLLSEMAGERTVILSTHIVEDIGLSCQDLAVLAGGRVRFRGSPNALIARAQGHVWLLRGDTPPTGDLVVTATLRREVGIEYRVVGQPPAGADATMIAPSLEDAYVWLMRAAITATTAA